VGGLWYGRNLLEFGSPLWPVAPAPWGDPAPPYYHQFTSLVASLQTTLEGRLDDYRFGISGGLVLVAAAVLAPLASRSRKVLIFAALSLCSALLWANSPFTGARHQTAAALATAYAGIRYLLPTLAVAAVTIALLTRERGRAAAFGWVALSMAIAANLAGIAKLSAELRTPLGWAVAGALAGALAAAILWRWWQSPDARWRAYVAGAGGLFVALAFSFLAQGWAERHVPRDTVGNGVVRWFSSSSPATGGAGRASFGGRPIGPAAGDDLKRKLDVIPQAASCADVRRRLHGGWVVIDSAILRAPNDPRRFTAGGCLQHDHPLFRDAEFAVYSDRAAARRQR
jgi:hypothetical protein